VRRCENKEKMDPRLRGDDRGREMRKICDKDPSAGSGSGFRRFRKRVSIVLNWMLEVGGRWRTSNIQHSTFNVERKIKEKSPGILVISRAFFVLGFQIYSIRIA
jgi:hypothetical protein